MGVGAREDDFIILKPFTTHQYTVDSRSGSKRGWFHHFAASYHPSIHCSQYEWEQERMISSFWSLLPFINTLFTVGVRAREDDFIIMQPLTSHQYIVHSRSGNKRGWFHHFEASYHSSIHCSQEEWEQERMISSFWSLLPLINTLFTVGVGPREDDFIILKPFTTHKYTVHSRSGSKRGWFHYFEAFYHSSMHCSQ